MRVVIVTHGYAPALNARAFRWTALAEHWASRGHEVHVVTVRSQGAAPHDMSKGVHVHRVGFYLDRLGLAARQSGHNRDDKSPGRSGLGGALKRAAVRAAKRIHDLTWKKIYWPDFAAPWLPFAAAKTRALLAGNPQTVVISVSLPFSGHLAAFLAGAGRRKAPWIVDTGDPFSFMTETPVNNRALYSRLNAAADRRILNAASALTVTTEDTRTEYVKLFGKSDKVKVIPPLLSVDTSLRARQTTAARSNLVYIGTLNRRIRNPDRLLSLFAAYTQRNREQGIELHFYGETGDCSASFGSLPHDVAARVHVHGLVSREDALAASRNALAVVNIGNRTHFQLPSKLVEYVATGRPIINLSSGPADSSVEFLAGVPGVLTLEESLSGADQLDRLAAFITEFRESSPPPVPDEWFSRFSLAEVARSYENIIASSAPNSI